jgi:DNA (cytosine-5)-methyltransferase 1
VPGVLSSGKGRDFGTFLGALGELGYGFAYRILDAQWFGVAQRRRRVFVVGHLGDWRRAAAVLFERESVFRNPPTRGKAGERVTGPIAGCSNGGGANGPGRTADDADSLVWRGGDQANSEHCIDHAGTLNCDKGQQGGIVAFHPTQDPISSTDGSTHAMGCGLKQGCCTQAVAFDTTQITSKLNYSKPKPGDPCHPLASGAHAPAVAFPISADADRQNSQALTPSPDAEGRVRLRDPGLGVGDSGEPMFTMQATKPHSVAYALDGGNQSTSDDVHHTLRIGRDSGDAVAFTPSHYTRGKDGAPSEVTAPLSADADKGDQDTVVAQGFTYSGYSNQPAWMTGDRTDCLPASGHSDGSHQGVGVMAFANRTRDGVKVPEVMPDGIVPALTNPGGGGRSDAVNVAQAMAVRRLTPRECERLQGFPDDYTLVEYRKKPAADGPRYRALGNSMAVPVMRWIGERIEMVERLAGRS